MQILSNHDGMLRRIVARHRSTPLMEELAVIERRAAGPIVMYEVAGAPYSKAEFWRNGGSSPTRLVS